LLIFITPTVVGDEAFHLTETGSEFLRTRFAEAPEEPVSAFDSAKPKDWTKPMH